MLLVCVVILTANFVDTGKATFGALGEVNLEPGESLLYQVQQVLRGFFQPEKKITFSRFRNFMSRLGGR